MSESSILKYVFKGCSNPLRSVIYKQKKKIANPINKTTGIQPRGYLSKKWVSFIMRFCLPVVFSFSNLIV